MGLLETHWIATYQDHQITVTRNEVSRGFAVQWDGRPIASRRWSLIGVGTVSGEVDLDGQRLPVVAELAPGAQCALTVGGQSVDCRRVG